MKPKIIALYLPQFHRIPENDEFWGEGFTDWVTVKNAKPLYNGHVQPNIPNNNKYYDLSKESEVRWQANLAKEYGVFGFGVYHYWFNNEKNLLTKPAEIMRDANDLGVEYFYIWDNCSWKRSWSNVEGNDWAPVEDSKRSQHSGPQVLIPYILGKESDWEKHYNYVKSHFASPNYEKRQNRPVFGIIFFSPEIDEMCKYWDRLAKRDGYDGIMFVFLNSKKVPSHYYRYSYEPHSSAWWKSPNLISRISRKVRHILGIKQKRTLRFFDYEKTWKQIVHSLASSHDEKLIPGGFVSYDDTPRRGASRGIVVKGKSVSIFKKYFAQLYNTAAAKGCDYIFLTAWNEWGEGAYLEPDVTSETSFLEVIRDITND